MSVRGLRNGGLSVQNGANDTTPQLQDGHNAAQTMMTVDAIGAGDEQVRNGKH